MNKERLKLPSSAVRVQSYREGRHGAIQLAVVSRLDVAAVVLVEVGEAVIHEDAALSIGTRMDASCSNCLLEHLRTATLTGRFYGNTSYGWSR